MQTETLHNIEIEQEIENKEITEQSPHPSQPIEPHFVKLRLPHSSDHSHKSQKATKREKQELLQIELLGAFLEPKENGLPLKDWIEHLKAAKPEIAAGILKELLPKEQPHPMGNPAQVYAPIIISEAHMHNLSQSGFNQKGVLPLEPNYIEQE